jgi:sarcosine oxidase subunit beta
MAGVRIPVTVTRHPVVVMQRPPAWRTPTPVWADLAGGWYFKPDGASGMMVGGIRDDDHAVDIDSHAEVPTEEETASAATAILRRFPIMEEGLAQRGWAGLYDVTPDSQPVIDRMAAVDGFVCAVGFSGHGFKIAPAVGRIVSELVMDGECRSYDVSIFRHGRFEAGDLHHSRYAHGIVG